MGIEGIIEERRPLDDLGIVAGDLGEPLADRPEPGGLGRRLDLGGKVRAMDDPGQIHQGRVIGESLVDQLLEGAPAPLVAVRIAGPRGVEAQGALAGLDRRHLLRLDEPDLRRGIDETPQEPGGRRPVDVHSFPGYPFHRGTLPSPRPVGCGEVLGSPSTSCYVLMSIATLALLRRRCAEGEGWPRPPRRRPPPSSPRSGARARSGGPLRPPRRRGGGGGPGLRSGAGGRRPAPADLSAVPAGRCARASGWTRVPPPAWPRWEGRAACPRGRPSRRARTNSAPPGGRRRGTSPRPPRGAASR